MDHGKFRKRWEIQTGNIPDHDFIIEFDGGTSCNIPSKGFGVGYGSFKINDLPIERVKFTEGYSANAAELETLYSALLYLDKYIREDVINHFAPSITICGDSCIALKWINCNCVPKENGSKMFRTVIKQMREFIKQNQESFIFGEITPFWRPRERSVELFGH